MSRLWAPLVAVVLMVATAAILFQAFQRQVSKAWFAFALHPEAIELLEASADDQRSLAREHPEREAGYRSRFDQIQTLLQRLSILEHSRLEMQRRYEQVLLALFVGTIGLAGGLVLWRQTRDERRLEGLRIALADLASGRTDLELGERRRDVIGRIARMIERTSRRMARDQKRLRSLENLSAWQEAARRHAHEMRTPLTGARLELERLGGMLGTGEGDGADDVHRAIQGVRQELDRLARFTQAFTSFARLPRPSMQEIDLDNLLHEYVTTFAAAWPNLELRHEAGALGPDPPQVAVDRDMLRQVLVNLCDNASLALEEDTGCMRFGLSLAGDQLLLDVADDGPGVAESVRNRLFEPYTTTRGIGKGMGLGLAICRKILLDHGGDLELFASSPEGATFRLSLPVLGASTTSSIPSTHASNHASTLTSPSTDTAADGVPTGDSVP